MTCCAPYFESRWRIGRADMDDDDRYFPDMDPRRLLPFTCELEPADPGVERLPKAYVGTDQQTYGGTGYV